MNLVIKPFIDKETQLGYSEGDIYESNDSKRVAFLVAKGCLKESTPAATSSTPARKRQVKKNAE